jgi:hypothetical protein
MTKPKNEPTPAPEPVINTPDRGPGQVDVPPPGRVRGLVKGKPPTGLAGLRARLRLSDRAGLDEVADSALGLIAELEDELSKPPRGDRLEIQSRSISSML